MNSGRECLLFMLFGQNLFFHYCFHFDYFYCFQLLDYFDHLVNLCLFQKLLNHFFTMYQHLWYLYFLQLLHHLFLEFQIIYISNLQLFVLLQKWTYHLSQIPHTIYYTFPCPVMILENSNFSFLMVELSIIQQIFCFVLQHSVRFCYNVSSRSFCLSNKQNNLSKASLGHFDSAKDAQWIQPFACQNRMFVLILEILVHKEVFQRRRISSKSKLDVFELSTLSNLDGYFYNQVSSP